MYSYWVIVCTLKYSTKLFIHQDTLIKDLTTATTSKNPFVSLHWLSVTKKVLSFYSGASLVNSPYSCMLYLQPTVTWFVFYKNYKSNCCKNGKSSTLFPALSYLSFMYNWFKVTATVNPKNNKLLYSSYEKYIKYHYFMFDFKH